MTLSLRTAESEIAGSMRIPPTRFIQNTVSLELLTSTRDRTGSVRPLVTRIRSP